MTSNRVHFCSHYSETLFMLGGLCNLHFIHLILKFKTGSLQLFWVQKEETRLSVNTMQLFTKTKMKHILSPDIFPHFSWKAFPTASHLHTISTHTNYFRIRTCTRNENSICIATIITISVKSDSTGTFKKYKIKKRE